MTPERRKHPRVMVKFLVEYRGGTVWQHAQSYNLSRGGMFISTEKTEPADTHIEVIFEIGKENVKRIHANAVVVWVREKAEVNDEGIEMPIGMGVEFTKIFPADGEKFLEELIGGMPDK